MLEPPTEVQTVLVKVPTWIATNASVTRKLCIQLLSLDGGVHDF